MSFAPPVEAQAVPAGIQGSPAAHSSPAGTLSLVCAWCRVGEVWVNKRGHQGRHMNHQERLGENLVCVLLAVTRGDGAEPCSEVYSGRMRGWPKKEDDPTGQKEKKIKNIIGRNFPERVWNALLVGFKDLLVLTQLLDFPSGLNDFAFGSPWK